MSASTTVSAPASASESSSVLSQKVARALEVRTDTPAMRAALDALADLPAGATGSTRYSSGAGSRSGSGCIDPRSVRHAIEMDALHQAKLFQDELRVLLETVSSLGRQVVAVREAVELVGREMQEDVVASSMGIGGGAGGAGWKGADGAAVACIGANAAANSDVGSEGQHDPVLAVLRGEEGGSIDLGLNFGSNLMEIDGAEGGVEGAALATEQRLACIIHSAFKSRHDAKIRADTVRQFLDKFDLSDKDSRLLDHYSFTDIRPDLVSEGAEMGVKYATTGGVNDGTGMEFLDALDRVRTIQSDLTTSFHLDSDGEANNPSSAAADDSNLGITSALRMMEMLSARQERAYERLYQFLLSFLDLHSRSVSNVPTSSFHNAASSNSVALAAAAAGDDVLDEALRHPFAVRAIQVLRYKRSYHSHILELVAGSRRALVTRKFLLALTSGYDGLPPIEMGAHDPVHYVGDMLAFIFRTFSEEADLIGGLGLVSGVQSGDAEEVDNADATVVRNFDAIAEESADDDEPMTPALVLSHAISGLTRPLKSRVTQVISTLASRNPNDSDIGDEKLSGDGVGHGLEGTLGPGNVDEEAGTSSHHLAQLYEVCGLLLYYRSAFIKAVRQVSHLRTFGTAFRGGGGSSPYSDSEYSNNAIVKCIQDCLNESASSYGASVRVYAATLPNLASLCNESEGSLVQGTIGRICEARLASPGFFGPKANVSSSSIEPEDKGLATLSLTFLVETTVGAAMSHCDRLDASVALRSAVMTAKNAGLDGRVAATFEKAIAEKERELANVLIEGETRRMLEDCGLAPLADALKDAEALGVEGMVFASHPGLGVADVKERMKDFNNSLYSPPLPSFERIRDPVLRKYARTRCAENVVETYGVIYEGLRGEKGGYDRDSLSCLGHNPSQVKTLLSL